MAGACHLPAPCPSPPSLNPPHTTPITPLPLSQGGLHMAGACHLPAPWNGCPAHTSPSQQCLGMEGQIHRFTKFPNGSGGVDAALSLLTPFTHYHPTPFIILTYTPPYSHHINIDIDIDILYTSYSHHISILYIPFLYC